MTLIEIAHRVSDETVGPRPASFMRNLEPTGLSLLQSINAAGATIVRGLDDQNLLRIAEIQSVGSASSDLVATVNEIPKHFHRFKLDTFQDGGGDFYDGPLSLPDYMRISKTTKKVFTYYDHEIHASPWTKKIKFAYFHEGWGRGLRRSADGIDKETELTKLSQDNDTFVVDSRLLETFAKYILLASLGQDYSAAKGDALDMIKQLDLKYTADSRPFPELTSRPTRYRYGM